MGKLASQSLNLAGIGFFLFYAFDGVFGDGGSDSVFIGVALLSGALAVSRIFAMLMPG